MEDILTLPPWRKTLVERRIANDAASERRGTGAIGSRIGRQLVAAWDDAEQTVVSHGAVWDRIAQPPIAKDETRPDWIEMNPQEIKDSIRHTRQQLNSVRQEEEI